MFRLSRKYRIYRFYNEDLWGELRCQRKLTTTFTYFIKQFRERKRPFSLFSKFSLRKQRRRSFYGDLITTRRKLSLFYGGLQPKSIKWDASSERMLHLLVLTVVNWEKKVSSVIYRAGFASTMLSALSLVLSGCVLVNNEVIVSPSHVVSLGDVVEITGSAKKDVYALLLSRLMLDRVIVVQPRYLEISFALLAVVLIKEPLLNKMYYPFQKTL